MKLLTQEWLQEQTIDLKMAAQLREIGEHKGRAELYGVHVLAAMESLRRVSAEHSAASACRLEPSDTSVEQANYLRVLMDVQDSAGTMPVGTAAIAALHAGLFQDSGREAGRFRSMSVSDEVERLCRNYLAQELVTEPLLLIGTFVVEFTRLQPFAAANARMALLVASWLLNRREFTVGRFVSLERILESKKTEFHAALQGAAMGDSAFSGKLAHWWSFWLEVLLQSYRELSARAGALGGRRGAKTDMILTWIGSVQGDFSIRQIQQELPECGIELIRKIIKEQKTAGKIQCTGRGPASLWRKKKTRTGRIL